MGKSIRFEKKSMGARVHYTRHNSWNTRSNKFRQVRTPGGRLAVQYVAKKAKGPQNAMVTSAKRLGGLNRMRPQNYRRIHKHYRRVSRACGVFDHSEVKNRIIRTFLTEEVKNVKKTMALQASLDAKKNKKAKKGAKGGAKKKVAKK